VNVTIITKQLKLRDHFRDLTLMHKLVFEIKICSIYKIFSLKFIPGA
jgi:hypothetical protein